MRAHTKDSQQFTASMHWNDFVAAVSLAAVGAIVSYLVAQ